MKADWRTLPCPRCGGHGLVSVYTMGGGDFVGAGECNTCSGSGQLWIRPSGHTFSYPSGPAQGMWSKQKYLEATPVVFEVVK
jgi:DnaJ-class molecular chaperone